MYIFFSQCYPHYIQASKIRDFFFLAFTHLFLSLVLLRHTKYHRKCTPQNNSILQLVSQFLGYSQQVCLPTSSSDRIILLLILSLSMLSVRGRHQHHHHEAAASPPPTGEASSLSISSLHITHLHLPCESTYFIIHVISSSHFSPISLYRSLYVHPPLLVFFLVTN